MLEGSESGVLEGYGGGVVDIEETAQELQGDVCAEIERKQKHDPWNVVWQEQCE